MTGAAATRPKQRDGSPWRVLAVVTCAALAGGAILAGFLILPEFVKVKAPQEVTDRDRELLIVAADFQPTIVHNDLEQVTKTRYEDETIEIAYLYDALSEEPPHYVRCQAAVAKNDDIAAEVYEEWIDARPRFDRADYVEQDELFAWGDQSQYGELLQDGSRCGQYFHCRKGSRVYSIVVFGLNTSAADEFSNLLTRQFGLLEAYEP